jgi:hypothetical protein
MSTHQYGRRVMHDPRDAGYLRARTTYTGMER